MSPIHSWTDKLVAITSNFALLEMAVQQFDGRFTLRVLRSIPTARKSPHFQEALANAIGSLFAGNPEAPAKHFLVTALGRSKSSSITNGDATHKTQSGDPLPEAFVYLAILVQVGRRSLESECRRYTDGSIDIPFRSEETFRRRRILINSCRQSTRIQSQDFGCPCRQSLLLLPSLSRAARSKAAFATVTHHRNAIKTSCRPPQRCST